MDANFCGIVGHVESGDSGLFQSLLLVNYLKRRHVHGFVLENRLFDDKLSLRMYIFMESVLPYPGIHAKPIVFNSKTGSTIFPKIMGIMRIVPTFCNWPITKEKYK